MNERTVPHGSDYFHRGFKIVEHRPKSNFGEQVFGGIVSVSMECDSGLAMTEPGTKRIQFFCLGPF